MANFGWFLWNLGFPKHDYKKIIIQNLWKYLTWFYGHYNLIKNTLYGIFKAVPSSSVTLLLHRHFLYHVNHVIPVNYTLHLWKERKMYIFFSEIGDISSFIKTTILSGLIYKTFPAKSWFLFVWNDKK